MTARMFFEISSMLFSPKRGIMEVNEGLLYLTDNDSARRRFYSGNIISEYGHSMTRFTSNSVFAYSDIQLSATGIVSPSQFQDEYFEAFKFRATYVEAFITFLWFKKDNSVGLIGTYGEIPEMKIVNGKSRSIISYNCKGEIEDTEFNQDELKWVGELTIKYYSISPVKKTKPDDTSMMYLYGEDGRPIRGIMPKTPEGFNYNAQTNIDRALHFLIIARNQDYLVYKIAYYMPIFECLFSTKNSEITFRIATRAAYYIADSPDEREEISKIVTLGYDIRSRFMHGQKFGSDDDISKEVLLDLSQKIDSYLRRILNKVITEDSEIFIKYSTTDRDNFLDKLLLGLPFDHDSIKKKIASSEADRERDKKEKERKLEKGKKYIKNK